jgi:hypothetical protein
MPQISIYISDEEMEMLREGAREEGVSLSRYTVDSITMRRAGTLKADPWPAGYWESVYGCLKDPTFVAPEDSPVDFDALDCETSFGI